MFTSILIAISFGILISLIEVQSRPTSGSVVPFWAASYSRAVDQEFFKSHDNDPNNVAFQNCQPDGYTIYGNVSYITIEPCDRATDDEPCTFVKGSNYTINLGFNSTLDAPSPRSSIVAADPRDGPYAYSGQSFNACKYASCPIHANVASVYTYHFRTLASSFNSLTFNVTQSFTGPSLFCASTDIRFVDKKQDFAHKK
ncbi:hypothetical protein O181_000474 [Austropuccinia psidii MF-1]|uniref:Phosphatidylglycerol/phosphatidylinositol transfer protein n=1 Tax=Austropuccinia psidii MF-1 TaxID=1389203 RepID=A0A9Q3B8L2_9BASI|nr:hypothetical protein [Austropuccinia psidii MF-1]